MNREYAFPNQQYTFHPQNFTNRFQEDWQLRSPEGKGPAESDLVIFNGEQPVKDMYSPNEQSNKSNLAFVPQKINKSPSQKAFPIIYNAYNEGGNEPQPKYQPFTSVQSPKPPIRIQQNEIDPFLENNHSNVSDKEHWQPYRRQEQFQSNEALTFQHIPHESEPQTAKFLHIPEKIPAESYFSHSQTEQYRPPEQFIQTRQTVPQPSYHFNPPQPSISHNRGNSRINFPPPVPSPKIVMQQPPQQRFLPSYQQQKQRVVQIPQQQYERLLQFHQQYRKVQQQNSSLKNKSQQLGQKQHFYWQQNMTLREQNKRLRDLVSHFQKREKQLLAQRQQQSLIFQQQISKYRDSTLQQLTLLLQRYKLQLQKKK